MKVFVAAEPLEGEGEFSYTIPGELVHLAPLVCDCPDCGCDRAMAGFASHKATTSFVVRDLDLTPTTYTELLMETLEAGGWVERRSIEDVAWVRLWARDHIDMAADLPSEVPLQIDGEGVTLKRADAR